MEEMNNTYGDGRRFEPGDEVIFQEGPLSIELYAAVLSSTHNRVEIAFTEDSRDYVSNEGWSTVLRVAPKTLTCHKPRKEPEPPPTFDIITIIKWAVLIGFVFSAFVSLFD